LSDFTVRAADANDAGRIAEIDAACFSTPRSIDAIESLVRSARVRVLVAECVGPTRAELADLRSEVVGHGILWHAADEAELADLAVHPAFRRRGIAAILLDRLIEEARGTGVRAIFLEVRVSNDAAMALYVGRGFRRVGVRRHYYRRPTENGVLLRLDLASDERAPGRR
jgi:ribosomal-protein-alanine N-acetyltransferase